MSGQAYKMGGLDENVSPAVIKDDVRKLQSKNRTLTFCTAFTLLLAFVGSVLAAFSARFVDENRRAPKATEASCSASDNRPSRGTPPRTPSSAAPGRGPASPHSPTGRLISRR